MKIRKEKKKNYAKTSISAAMIQKMFGSKSIKKQLYATYFVALFIPIAILGTFLVTNTYALLKNYYLDLVASDNLRVKAIFFEITAEAFNVSEYISGDDRTVSLLDRDYTDQNAFIERANEYLEDTKYIANYSEIQEVVIYTDNPSVVNYQMFKQADEKILNAEWYEQAVAQENVFWVPVKEMNDSGSDTVSLCLVRRITLPATGHHAVVMIRISDNYLRTRVETSEYETVVGLDDDVIVYASDKSRYGQEMYLDIDNTNPHYSYEGDMKIDGIRCITDVVTLNMYQSKSRLYICTLNREAYQDILRITVICLLIIAIALVFSGGMIVVYTQYITGRVEALRQEMHKASHGEYNILSDFRGQDELSAAFTDLQVMVERIQEKDAAIYRTQISEKELMNRQQEMEFKMLASQINPHFLYNTLETIRMNAFTAGNKEVATSIKLLGKSLRYVLENTGTTSTTLKSELDYIDNYIKIQKLRFGDRINYRLVVEDGIILEDYYILPLLLQPIVENAILHGLEEKEENGQITVKVFLRGELHIEIADNGCGMESGQVQKLRNSIAVKNPHLKASIGLYNINQRIKLCYGKQYGLGISSVPGCGTTIAIVIPAKNESAADGPED